LIRLNIVILVGAQERLPVRLVALRLPAPLAVLAEIWSPFSTSNPAGRGVFHQRRNGVAPCEGRDLYGSQASCEPTSTNSKFSLLPYQPFDLPNKQLFQPSLFFLQRLVYGLAYNGDVVVFGSARATACRLTNVSLAGI